MYITASISYQFRLIIYCDLSHINFIKLLEELNLLKYKMEIQFRKFAY